MPRILDRFQLVDIPQTSDSTPNIHVAYNRSSSNIHLGISHSAVTSYRLKPTPSLSWTHSIPPSCSITALAECEQSFCVGVLERMKNSIRVVSKSSDQKEPTYQVPYEVSGLGFGASGDHFYSVSRNSDLRCHQTDSPDSEVWMLRAKEGRSLMYSVFVPSTGDDNEGPQDGVVVLVTTKETSRKPEISASIIALEPTGAEELVVRDLETKEDKIKPELMAYHDGVFYRYSMESGKLHCLNLLKRQGTKFSVGKPNSETYSILPVGDSKLLLLQDQDIFLVDTKFQSVVDSRPRDGLVRLLCFAVDSVAVAVSEASVVGLNVDKGHGTLLESIGKGRSAGEDEAGLKLGFTGILIKKKSLAKEYRRILMDLIVTAQDTAAGILVELDELKQQGNVDEFEKRAIGYLKGEEWDEEADNEKEHIPAYEARDREVDKDFIVEIVAMLFVVKDNKLILQPGFVPEKLVIYLLTHPLFPTPEMSNLLSALIDHPRLFRQAVVTAPGIDCPQLIEALAHPDEEIFRDVANRVLEEFGAAQITEAVRSQYFSPSGTAGPDKVQKLINRLSRLDIGWSLISAFVDASGLFGWSAAVIEDLNNRVSSEIKALESSAEIVTLIDEAIRKFAHNMDASGMQKLTKNEIKSLTPRAPGEKTHTGPAFITAEEREQEKMKGLLAYGVAEEKIKSKLGKKKAWLDQKSMISRRVPVYTVEKLVF
jgi:U3 small nucleolar RNA-associated protein 8